MDRQYEENVCWISYLQTRKIGNSIRERLPRKRETCDVLTLREHHNHQNVHQGSGASVAILLRNKNSVHVPTGEHIRKSVHA